MVLREILRMWFNFLYFSFLAASMAYGSSWARDKIQAGAVIYATAAATLHR